MGPVPIGLEISNNYCGVMDAFRGLKLIICRDIGLILNVLWTPGLWVQLFLRKNRG